MLVGFGSDPIIPSPGLIALNEMTDGGKETKCYAAEGDIPAQCAVPKSARTMQLVAAAAGGALMGAVVAYFMVKR